MHAGACLKQGGGGQERPAGTRREAQGEGGGKGAPIAMKACKPLQRGLEEAPAMTPRAQQLHLGGFTVKQGERRPGTVAVAVDRSPTACVRARAQRWCTCVQGHNKGYGSNLKGRKRFARTPCLGALCGCR